MAFWKIITTIIFALSCVWVAFSGRFWGKEWGLCVYDCYEWLVAGEKGGFFGRGWMGVRYPFVCVFADGVF